MKSSMARVFSLVCLAMLVAPLFGQGPGGGRGQGGGRGPGGFGGPGGGLDLGTLMTNKGVIDELKISEEQGGKLKSALKEVTDKFSADLASARQDKNREKMQEIRQDMTREMTKVVEGILKPEQAKRLTQVEIWSTLQTNGPGVFAANEKVKAALKLTDAQKSSIAEATQAIQKARMEAFSEGRGDPEKMQEIQAKMRKMQTEAVEKIQGTLTDDQKKAWKELVGEKFEYKPTPRRQPI